MKKTLGYEAFGEGSFKQGVNAIKAIIHAKTNINFSNLQLADGSGMSRYNLITPRSITRLLYVIMQDKKLNSLFYATLADAGLNGTLKNRYTSFDLKNNIHAKTGTIQNGTALSGYIDTKDQNKLVFSILINQMLMERKEATAFIANLGELLTQGQINN